MTGSTIGGRYELLETIGEGGFAVTWRAWDSRLERAVALKLLRPQYASDERFVVRFVREARAAASVSHPNVVRLYDFGQESRTVYLAMQYVQGQTLRDVMRRFPGGMPERDAIQLIAPVLRGLSAIHAAGIIHRDVKPDNVLIDRNGEVLITDFGIALLSDSTRLTAADTTFGTAAYMAPEQGRGESVSAATDLYATGVMLFEMLTGRLPFTAENPVAMMMAHQDQTPPLPSQVARGATIPPATEAAVMRALAKQPADRFQSASEILDALSGRSAAPTTRIAPPTTTIPMQRAPRIQPASAPPRPIQPPVGARRSSPWGWLIALLLLAGIAAAGAAYAKGYFDSSGSPGTNAPVVQPTATEPPTEEPTQPAIEGPTIAPVDVPTEVIDTPTPVLEETPTDTPESSPHVPIEPIDGTGP
jgi:eukaryotic-like serine/threonine-protein kinase